MQRKRYPIQIETNQRKWRGRRLSPAFARTVRLRHRAVGWHLGCLEVRILSMQCQFCPSLRSIPVPLATQHGVSQHLNEEEKFARKLDHWVAGWVCGCTAVWRVSEGITSADPALFPPRQPPTFRLLSATNLVSNVSASGHRFGTYGRG